MSVGMGTHEVPPAVGSVPADSRRSRSRGPSSTGISAVLLAPAVLFTVLAFVIPVGAFALLSFNQSGGQSVDFSSLGWGQYQAALADPLVRQALWRTPLLAVEVALASVAFGYVIAAAINRARSALVRTLLYVAVLSPLLTSDVVRTYAWLVILSDNGVINRSLTAIGVIDEPLPLLFSQTAILAGMVYVMAPLGVFPLIPTMRDVAETSRASELLGMGPVRTFFKVTLPLTSHGAIVSGLLVFVLAMGAYITPLILGGGTTSLMGVQIYSQQLSFHNSPRAAALSVLLLLLTGLVATAVSMLYARWRRGRFS